MYLRRSKNIFDPKSGAPFKLSRSKIDLYVQCPRCFYYDRRLGIGRPPSFPFNLNSAVDQLLKKEFDGYRRTQTPHPLMERFGIDAVPFQHPNMDKWRENFVGIQYLHEPTNFIITGAVDDLWVSADNKISVVDYKATSKKGEVSINADWQYAYKRQLEIYQWLLRKKGFNVSDTGYFVYCNGMTDKDSFDAKLEFSIKVIPYTGSDCWIEDILSDIRKCLTSDDIPKMGQECDYCSYIHSINECDLTPELF